MDMKSRRTSGFFYVRPGTWGRCTARYYGRIQIFGILRESAAVRHPKKGHGMRLSAWGKVEDFCVPLCTAASGAELSPGAHSVDERVGQSESTSGQEADRRQDVVFCSSLFDSVRHPAPFREVAHDSLILSCYLQLLWPFIHCARASWAYLPPMPEGTAYEPGKDVCSWIPKNFSDNGCPGTERRGGLSFPTRGTGMCAGAACGIPLAGHA